MATIRIRTDERDVSTIEIQRDDDNFHVLSESLEGVGPVVKYFKGGEAEAELYAMQNRAQIIAIAERPLTTDRFTYIPI